MSPLIQTIGKASAGLFIIIALAISACQTHLPKEMQPPLEKISAPIYDLDVDFKSKDQTPKILSTAKECLVAKNDCPPKWPKEFAGTPLIGGKITLSEGKETQFPLYGGLDLEHPELIGLWENESFDIAFRVQHAVTDIQKQNNLIYITVKNEAKSKTLTFDLEEKTQLKK